MSVPKKAKVPVDRAFFYLINGMAGKNVILDSIMLFLSQDMIFVFAACLLIYAVFGGVHHSLAQRKSAAGAIVFSLLCLGVAALLSALIYVPRPFVRGRVNLLYPHKADSAFPSDHATLTMSVALGLGKGEKKLGLVLALISLAVGFSRVYVGHHTPADILGSYLMVFLLGVVYNLFIRRYVEQAYEKSERLILKKWERKGRADR